MNVFTPDRDPHYKRHFSMGVLKLSHLRTDEASCAAVLDVPSCKSGDTTHHGVPSKSGEVVEPISPLHAKDAPGENEGTPHPTTVSGVPFPIEDKPCEPNTFALHVYVTVDRPKGMTVTHEVGYDGTFGPNPS